MRNQQINQVMLHQSDVHSSPADEKSTNQPSNVTVSDETYVDTKCNYRVFIYVLSIIFSSNNKYEIMAMFITI